MRICMPSLLLATTLAAASPLLNAAERSPKIVAFNVGVRVDVDATGKPVKVEAPQDVPEAIRTFIEKRVASWQYEAAKLGGVAVPATTYVQVAACAIPTPTGDAYRLAADFDGNGPRREGDRPMQSPKYPRDAQRRGLEAEFVVVVDVATDGKAKLSVIEHSEVSRSGRVAEFEQELRRWAKTLRFDPEQVAGTPVAGQVRFPVHFDFSTHAEWRSKLDELQAKASASRECQMAQGSDAMLPVAVESVIKVTPVPAS